MKISIGFYNLWLLFFLGYGLIWLLMIIVNKKRGNPIEDNNIHQYVNKTKMLLFGFVPHILCFVWSVFVPINQGRLLWIGLPVFILGVGINIAAMLSFHNPKQGLNTSGIYQYSRNPMYVGFFLFILGLNIMGAAVSLTYFIFLAISISWCCCTHWCVLKEEIFLKNKYGKPYEKYLTEVHRYL